MFVTNHVLSGAIVGKLLPDRPVAAFMVGVGSHLFLDCCPHWGIDGADPNPEGRFLEAARRDGLLGLGVLASSIATSERRARLSTTAAIFGAVLLDLDKPCEHFLGLNPFPYPIQRLHGYIQNESPKGMRTEVLAGIAFAVVTALMSLRSRHRGVARGTL